MTRKQIRDVLDEAVGQTRRVDLAEAAWAQGVGMRRRRRAALAGGGTLLAAAAVAGALVLSGTLPLGEEVAPALPSPSPGPTQVEPGPVDDLAAAHTFIFTREGVEPGLDEISDVADLLSAADVEVPTLESLAGSRWQLNTLMRLDYFGEQDAMDQGLRIGDERTIGSDVPTVLSFSPEGQPSLSMDQCGDVSFDDVQLGADGWLPGQVLTNDMGCAPDAQAAEDFWWGALANGGWLHQPSDDILLLSVTLPEGAVEEDAVEEGAPATWRLLDAEAVTVDTQTLRIGVTRESCASGHTGVVLEPIVTYERDRVLIRTDVESLSDGMYTCQGNEEVEVEVALDEPLGERDLLDASCHNYWGDYLIPCDRVIQWAYPRGEPVEIPVDPYLIATTPQEFVDWGSHVVWGEVVAEREIEPRFPDALGAGETGREIDLDLWDVPWSHPDAVTGVPRGQVITLEVSPGWIDGQSAVLEGDTRLEIGHVYTLALVDTYDDGEQYLAPLFGSVTESTEPYVINELLSGLEGVTPDPDRGPRPGEAWDERYVRASGLR